MEYVSLRYRCLLCRHALKKISRSILTWLSWLSWVAIALCQGVLFYGWCMFLGTENGKLLVAWAGEHGVGLDLVKMSGVLICLGLIFYIWLLHQLVACCPPAMQKWFLTSLKSFFAVIFPLVSTFVAGMMKNPKYEDFMIQLLVTWAYYLSMFFAGLTEDFALMDSFGAGTLLWLSVCIHLVIFPLSPTSPLSRSSSSSPKKQISFSLSSFYFLVNFIGYITKTPEVYVYYQLRVKDPLGGVFNSCVVI